MEGLLNFYQSTDEVGTAGQPRPEQFAEIAARGYAAVINLAMPDSDNAIPEEGRIVSALGMSYVHIPVPFDAPTAAHLRRFFRVMDALEGERVFVHCALNLRVSAFMHQYLTLARGRGSEESSSPFLREWRRNMEPEWQAIMALTRADLAP